MAVVVWQAAGDGPLIEFFHGRLLKAAREVRPQPQEDTRHYLGQMLERFSQSDQLFEYHEGQLGLRPLAMLYGDAQQASSERERCLLLQRLGDLSLFLGALFPDVYSRRGIRRDYFIGMGGGAYDYLSERAPNQRHVFDELNRRFVQMTDMVARACFRRSGNTASEEIMRLYGCWLETRDPVLAEQLRSLGVQLNSRGH